MAFYGRINNNQANTSMTFDKVYPNRTEMDKNAADDGVFVGRFVLVEYGDNDEEYSKNYSIDNETYTKLGRGYDSTVWRKVLPEDGKGYYVMLAELNSVVPTFDIEAEAPGSSSDPTKPIKPHFDKDSTNVYYNLHVGTPWGFKVDNIDFNQSGFNKDVINESGKSLSDNNITMNIGYSGEKYYDHDTNSMQPGLDQQQLNINLPAIGDTISKVWDVVYGDEVANGGTKRNTTIGYVDEEGNPIPRTGLRMVSSDDGALIYTPEKINNLAGALNSVYDLIGMNIYPLKAEMKNNPGETDPNYIYYDKADKKFYVKGYDYDLMELDPNNSEHRDIINKGSYPEAFTGILIDPTVGDLVLYTKPTTAEHYYVLLDNNKVKADVVYYTLNHLSDFANPNAETISTDDDFETLVAEKKIFTIVEDGRTKILNSASGAYDATKIYYIVNTESSVEEKYYFPNSTDTSAAFYTKSGERISSYPTSKIVLYQLISDSEPSHPIDADGNIDYSRIVYTTTLEPVGISRSLADDPEELQRLITAGDAVEGLKPIDKWPTQDSGDITNENNI